MDALRFGCAPSLPAALIFLPKDRKRKTGNRRSPEDGVTQRTPPLLSPLCPPPARCSPASRPGRTDRSRPAQASVRPGALPRGKKNTSVSSRRWRNLLFSYWKVQKKANALARRGSKEAGLSGTICSVNI